jgi:hypothetical protein
MSPPGGREPTAVRESRKDLSALNGVFSQHCHVVAMGPESARTGKKERQADENASAEENGRQTPRLEIPTAIRTSSLTIYRRPDLIVGSREYVVDIALWDLAAQRAGVPLGPVHGQPGHARA